MENKHNNNNNNNNKSDKSEVKDPVPGRAGGAANKIETAFNPYPREHVFKFCPLTYK